MWLASVFDTSSMGVCTTGHWQMSGRLVQELNVCTVGVKACIFDNDDSCISEKSAVRTGSYTLNATTGLGIRKRGVCMSVCNTIYWAIVVPIITFGCKAWVLSDNDKEKLLAFQRFAGSRVLRLSYNSPYASYVFRLALSRLTTYSADI